MPNKEKARERILHSTIKLLQDGADLKQLTMRYIAEQADVGVGLINYHFQSKDNLLNQAAIAIMEEMTVEWGPTLQYGEGDAESRLRLMLKAASDFVIQYPTLAQIPVSYDLTQGTMSTPTIILSLLREMQPEKAEWELRLLALHLVTTLQVIFLRSQVFRSYASIDIFDDQQRNKAIDLLIDTIVQA